MADHSRGQRLRLVDPTRNENRARAEKVDALICYAIFPIFNKGLGRGPQASPQQGTWNQPCTNQPSLPLIMFLFAVCMLVYSFLHLQHKYPLEGSRSTFSRAPDGRPALRIAHCFLVLSALSDLSTFATFSILSSLKSFTNIYLLRVIHPYRNHTIWLLCAPTIALQAVL